VKKIILLWAALLAGQITTALGQYVVTDSVSRPSASFVRLFPFELLMREFRLGFEVETAPRQSLVIDGSYFSGATPDRPADPQSGWAIMVDYRIYSEDVRQRSRFFAGPNFMFKQQGITNYTGSSSGNGFSTTPQTVLCGNLKLGMDFQFNRKAHPRLELFTGPGLRYQAPGITLNFFERGPGYKQHTLLPNVLLGLILKL
jgi:hypothetical protein